MDKVRDCFVRSLPEVGGDAVNAAVLHGTAHRHDGDSAIGDGADDIVTELRADCRHHDAIDTMIDERLQTSFLLLYAAVRGREEGAESRHLQYFFHSRNELAGERVR